MTSMATTGWSRSLLASACSVVIFNYFLPPRASPFMCMEKDYPVTFVVMFVVALLSSALTTRLKDHARQSAKLAYRTKVLFDTNQLLQKAETDEAILNTLISQIRKLLENTSSFIRPGRKNWELLSSPRILFPRKNQNS